MNNFSVFKYLQRTKGLSRRDFFDMIKKGIIFLNDKRIEDINQELVLSDRIDIRFPDGQRYSEVVEKFPVISRKIILFNKPKGYVVSKEDEHNKTIYEILPKSFEKDFFYIGRLDKDSHGLLLLTNDSSLVDYYENPKNRILKIYEVRIDRLLRTGDIVKLKKGVNADEQGNRVLLDPKKEEVTTPYENLKFFDIHKVSLPKVGEVLRIVLDEGKKRHIRRALKSLGYRVIDIKRIKEGKYELGDIKEGKYRIYKA